MGHRFWKRTRTICRQFVFYARRTTTTLILSNQTGCLPHVSKPVTDTRSCQLYSSKYFPSHYCPRDQRAFEWLCLRAFCFSERRAQQQAGRGNPNFGRDSKATECNNKSRPESVHDKRQHKRNPVGRPYVPVAQHMQVPLRVASKDCHLLKRLAQASASRRPPWQSHR